VTKMRFPRIRLSLREIFLLIAILAIVLAWSVNRHQLMSDLQESKKWRNRAGALEHVLHDNGWTVEWEREWVQVDNRSISVYHRVSTTDYEPGKVPE
jgi:hypothetical protein